MAERVQVMLTEEQVDARIRELGEQISRDYAGKTLHLPKNGWMRPVRMVRTWVLVLLILKE